MESPALAASLLVQQWPTAADDRLREDVNRLLRTVVAAGGAIGYLAPPTRAQTDSWLDGMLAKVRGGNGALLTLEIDGRIVAMGVWVRETAQVRAHSAELGKIMTDPEVRGRGLGRRLTTELVEHARQAGMETLTLGVRGNNYGAIELYESLGFREWGRLPNVLEVGDERYDQVNLCLQFERAPELVLRGSLPGGNGCSPSRRPQE
jgi:ribosomal protein S18 acetylase RimI-like enzyme